VRAGHVHTCTTSGWSCRCAPTPGRSSATGMPCWRRCSAGPMPESISSCGDWMAPALRITSRSARSVFSCPSCT
jgi:hypothetical protein